MTVSVLLVDDDDAFRGLARRMLVALGLIVVDDVATVAEARVAAGALCPQAALVDIGLPDGDGLTLGGELAAMPWRPRVVLTSSESDAVTCSAVRGAGVIGFLPKDELASHTLLTMLTGR
jgi:DNA-binding NarL/FixJ family response regulator